MKLINCIVILLLSFNCHSQIDKSDLLSEVTLSELIDLVESQGRTISELSKKIESISNDEDFEGISKDLADKIKRDLAENSTSTIVDKYLERHFVSYAVQVGLIKQEDFSDYGKAWTREEIVERLKAISKN